MELTPPPLHRALNQLSHTGLLFSALHYVCVGEKWVCRKVIMMQGKGTSGGSSKASKRTGEGTPTCPGGPEGRDGSIREIFSSKVRFEQSMKR